SESPESPAPDNRDTTGEAESGEAPPPAVEEPPASPVAAPSSPVKKWLVVGGIVLLSALALIIGWRPFMAWLNTDAAANSALVKSSAVEKTQATLTELGLQDITIAARPDGGVVLTGYCATRDVKNRLTAALLAQGVRVDNRLWPEEVLKNAIGQTLERLGGKMLRYTYSGKGVLHLRGVLRTDLSNDELLSTLRNDVPGIIQIESAVKTIEDFASDLRGQVRQAALEAQVTITVASATGLVATGALDAERMERWNAMAQSFVAETQGIPTLETQILLNEATPISQPVVEAVQPVVEAVPPVVVERVVTEQPAAPLRMVVRGIVVSPGQVPYALLDDGTRITEGDRIEGRYLVEKIHFNRVVVRDGSNRKVFYIGDTRYDRRQ
ncbi:MAG TPA: EscD/YscD/HrpQ family type III secretion system inner membrane ring protein, partial [Gammaproteobacteria bacterium]|nr:EscD/YscD/HrpQ family type III secretion system inner membrane ring protein [Gammaproteobacteria bacterium]